MYVVYIIFVLVSLFVGVEKQFLITETMLGSCSILSSFFVITFDFRKIWRSIYEYLYFYLLLIE